MLGQVGNQNVRNGENCLPSLPGPQAPTGNNQMPNKDLFATLSFTLVAHHSHFLHRMPDLVSRTVCSKYSHCIAYKPEPHKSPYVHQAPLLYFLCSELLSSVPLTVSPLCMAIFVPDPRRDPPFQSHQSLLLKKYSPFKIQGPSSAALDGFLVSSGYWKVAIVIALSCSALPSFACWRH